MRILLLTVCFILTACASTPKSDNYFRATGIGNTYEEAKHNAFKEAIEYQVGVVIASERESYNEKLIKNEILAYSSAFVDEYKIISQQNIGNKIQVVVDVKLSLLRLSDRILSKGKDSKNLEGAKHNNQYKSFLENKNNGDRILASVLNDYPRRAYDIKQSDYVVKIDTYRNLTLTIPYTLSWNPNYIASFHDAIKIVADGKPSLWSVEKGFAQQYPSTVRIGSEKYYFNEFVITEKILDAIMDWNEVRINMEIKDFYNKTQYSECFKPVQLHRNVGDYYNINYVKTNNIGINTTAGEKASIEMKIQQNSKLANIMYNLSKIELSVVPKKVCVKNN
jgi:hypothetical protein